MIDKNVRDEDYNSNERITRKSSTVLLHVPRNILQHTALTSARTGQSSRSLTMNTAQTIVSSGGDLKDFVLSQSSANRARNKAVKTSSSEIKELLRSKLIEIGRQFVVHFDGKMLQDITNQVRSVNER